MATRGVNKIEELEALVSLAESVSKNSDQLRDRLNKYLFVLFFFILFISLAIFGSISYFSTFAVDIQNQYRNVFWTAIFTSLFLALVFVIQMSANLLKLSKQLQSESKVLERLLDLTHSFRENLGKSSSIVKGAIIDMRLNRINFSQNNEVSSLIFSIVSSIKSIYRG